jgi:hypothetical protein
MLLMPLFFRQLFRLLFFTRPKSGFGLCLPAMPYSCAKEDSYVFCQ